MTKLDLILINEQGHGRPVPVEMELHLIKYFVGLRIREVEANPDLLTVERWDHSDVFYASRTHLNRQGWDTSVYNDNVKGGAERRKKFYDKIKSVCEDYYGKKRHQIGIFPDDRAVKSFKGQQYANFDSLRSLMGYGTDIVFVVTLHPLKRSILPTDHDGVKDRQNDIMFGDRSSHHDEKMAYLVTDLRDFAAQE
jgi:hypothetical protein